MDATIDFQEKTPNELCDIIKQLKGALVKKNQIIAFRNQEIESLRYKLNVALRQRFGRKSEKDTKQLSLFDEIKTPDNPQEVEKADSEITVASHKRRKKCGRKPLAVHLPRIQKIHDLPAEEKICTCGHEMVKIGEDISEQLDIIPARIHVIQHVKYKYACKPCEGNVKQAKAPIQPIPKSIASPGLLAHIAVSKYCDHLPLYRQESILQRMGVDIARNTTSHWMIKVSDLLRPLYKLLHYNLSTYDIAYADETRTLVLKEGDRAPEAKSFMWCFIGGHPEKRSIIYHYNISRAHTVILEMLEDFKGALHCDGFSGYDAYARITPGVTLLGCWMHCRRKFYDVAKSTKTEGLAHQAIKKIAKLYRLEKDVKAKNLTANEIFHHRQKYSKPKLLQFKAWLDKHYNLIPPKSPLGNAFGYALNQWHKLIQYINDGRLEMDNGISERQIKPFVIGRKNWLFCNSIAGARAAEVIFSILETAKFHQIEPYAYLRLVLTCIPSISTEKELEALLPYNVDLQKLII